MKASTMFFGATAGFDCLDHDRHGNQILLETRLAVSDVVVAGVGMTRFAKQPDRTMKELGREATLRALGDAGIIPSDVGVAIVSNAVAGLITGQEMIRGQLVLREAGIGGIPIVNVENACAGGSTALHLAWLSIASGQTDVALALGVEKLTHPDKAISLKAFSSAIDIERAAELAESLNNTNEGPSGPRRSVFMDIYAAAIREYMARSGATRDHLAMVTMKSHRFGSMNPLAQYQSPLTKEAVLLSPIVADPLTREMCAPIGDGAAAAVLMSAAAARRYGLMDRPRVVASVLRSGRLPDSDGEPAEDRAIAAGYAAAGLGPRDLDVAEVHDATAPAELLTYERLGLCPAGEGIRLLENGDTDLGGRIPVNTSGGLVARGHPIGATGLAQVCEVIWQLRNQCGERQVQGARIGLTQNGGGYLGNDAAAEAVHIFAR